MKTTIKTASVILAAISLISCGGGGGGSSAAAPAQNQIAAGVWTTTYVVTSGANAGDTIKAIALVSPTGQFNFAGVNQTNHCASVGFGQASVSGSAFSGSEDAVVVTFSNDPGINTACAFPDGSTSATGTITGTVTSGQTLVVTGSGTTSRGTALPSSTDTYTYSSLSNVAPSLATVAGTYVAADGSTLTVSSSGVIAETSVTTGCTLSGQITIPSSSYNIYNITVSYAACGASYTALNGVSLSGLATYDNSVSPNQLDVGLSGTIGSTLVAFAAAIPK